MIICIFGEEVVTMSDLTVLLERQKALQTQMDELESQILAAKSDNYQMWGELFSKLLGDDLVELALILQTSSEDELLAIRKDVLPVLTASVEAVSVGRMQNLFPMNAPETSEESADGEKPVKKRTSRKKTGKVGDTHEKA